MLGQTALSGADAVPDPPHRVLVIGDSLAVGTERYLGEMLPGYDVRWDVRSGRTTPEGLRRLRGDLRAVQPQTVVVSLGTNDGSDPRRFEHRIRRVLAAVPADACVVWASVYRPARKGRFLALNRVLERTAARDPRVTIVEWDEVVRSGAVHLPDGLHPDDAGYHYRSNLFAEAVKGGC